MIWGFIYMLVIFCKSIWRLPVFVKPPPPEPIDNTEQLWEEWDKKVEIIKEPEEETEKKLEEEDGEAEKSNEGEESEKDEDMNRPEEEEEEFAWEEPI